MAKDKAESAAAAARAAEELATRQAADRKAVADAKAAKKAAGYGGAYQNINAGLSYDAPAGAATAAIAARPAAFKPTMDKFTQAQAANAATLAKAYKPTVVGQPYNNTDGYGNVLNPTVPDRPITSQPPVEPPQPPVDTRYTGPAITDKQVMDWLKSNPQATDRQIAQEMDKFNVRPDQVARATGMQGVDSASMQNINRRYDMAKAANSGNAFAIAQQNKADAVTGQGIREYFAKNPGMTDAQIAGYMDQNAIDPRQLEAAFAGTAGAISAPDVFSRYQAATKPPSTPPQKLLNMGGIASLGSGGYPRRTGQISGPGTETSDSIPAMLSDGEFVMTAKAVRGAGKGDRRAGAKRMYALMNQLEKNAARG